VRASPNADDGWEVPGPGESGESGESGRVRVGRRVRDPPPSSVFVAAGTADGAAANDASGAGTGSAATADAAARTNANPPSRPARRRERGERGDCGGLGDRPE
jgi:hypothetical protein